MTSLAPLPPPAPAIDWAAELDRLATDPDTLRLVFQPIVDVARGVVAGYETLARFRSADGSPSPATPDRWFAAADAAGIGARVEALVVARCLQLRADLPPNCFLTVNVSPHLLTEPELADLLLGAGDLSPLVLELTEHQAVADVRPLLAVQDALRDRGALVALDDAGSGYSGLQQLTAFRPQLIKLDRALVDGADADPVKLALATLLGEFGARIDAWLLAEGVETWGEMEAFSRLGVPLAQGFLLGRPAPPWSSLDPAVADRLRRSHAQGLLRENIASLVERVELVAGDAEPPDPVRPSGSTGSAARSPSCCRCGAGTTDRGTAPRRSRCGRRPPPGWPSSPAGWSPGPRTPASTPSCASTTSAPCWASSSSSTC